MTFSIIKGPAAIAFGKYWVGVASGNRYCKQKRRTSEKALEDAVKLEDVGDGPSKANIKV